MDQFKGTKTYFVAFAAACVTVLKFIGFLDENTYMSIMGMLNAAGLATLRAGVTTEVKKL